MYYITFKSHGLHWRYTKIALREYVIKRDTVRTADKDYCRI